MNVGSDFFAGSGKVISYGLFYRLQQKSDRYKVFFSILSVLFHISKPTIWDEVLIETIYAHCMIRVVRSQSPFGTPFAIWVWLIHFWWSALIKLHVRKLISVEHLRSKMEHDNLLSNKLKIIAKYTIGFGALWKRQLCATLETWFDYKTRENQVTLQNLL